MKSVRKTVVLLGLIIFSALNIAHARDAIDAVVVIDSSGSMKKTDPHNLRKSAAKLFISLLGAEDRISVMSFSDNAYPITYLTSLDNDANLNKSIRATDKISSRGIYTNINAAVARAHQILTTDSSDRKPIIVLLSDGKMDVENEEKSASLTEQLIQQELAKLKESGIKLYSIAFTDASDHKLLDFLAEETGAFSKIAETDADLHLAFSSIFEESKQPDMLPLSENKFTVDDSIREITIVANKESPDSKIMLENPQQERFDAATAVDYMKWFVSDSFDMISINKPVSGEWKILFSDNNNKAYIVTDIGMKIKFEFTEENAKKTLITKAWLEQEDQIVNREELLNTLTASMEIADPDDNIKTLNLGRAIIDEEISGIYQGSYKPQLTGTYIATVTIKSETFQRQQTFSFRADIPAPPVKPVIPPEPEVKPDTQAKNQDENKEDKKAPEEQESDIVVSIIIFIAINVAIIFIGLIIYLVLKLKREKQPATEDTEE